MLKEPMHVPERSPSSRPLRLRSAVTRKRAPCQGTPVLEPPEWFCDQPSGGHLGRGLPLRCSTTLFGPGEDPGPTDSGHTL